MGGSEAAAPVGSDGLGQPVGEQRAARLRSLSLLVLTMGSGATDALAFLGLGGVFTANMTGNLVLVGLVGRTDYPGAAFRAVVACIGFGAAVRVSVMITRRFQIVRRTPGTALLGMSLGLQAAFLACWLLVAAEPSSSQTISLVVLSSAAMGVQTAAVRSMTETFGITTTFVTGTMTSLMADGFPWRAPGSARRGAAVRLATVLALPLGALTGALVLEHARLATACLAPAAVLTAVVLNRVADRHATPPAVVTG